jgi:hypothetical protein
MSPFGFVVDGLDEDQEVDEKGNVWTLAADWEDSKWDSYREKIDEYGLSMGTWSWN